LVELHGLTKVFKNIRAVDNLSFRVEEEIYGLLGENGAGKTTTLRMLVAMVKPPSGTAKINGKDLIKEPEAIRSIVHEPKVMLFDEPTSGLDVGSVREVHDFIRFCKEEGKTIIFSSHSMAEVEKLCDKIGIIHKGKLIEEGSIEVLKEKYKTDNLEELFMEFGR